MILMREIGSERNATPVRSGNLRVGVSGGWAFKLQKPPQLRVPRPSLHFAKGGYDDGIRNG
jgi:hypothetical protein